MDLIKVTHDELETTLRDLYAANEAVFLHGNIGIGKSQHVRIMAQEFAENQGREFVAWNESSRETKKDVLRNPTDYYVFVDKRMSEEEPSSLKGLPEFTEVTHEMESDEVNDEEMNEVWEMDEESQRLVQSHKYTEWQIPMWAAVLCANGASGFLFLDEANLAPNIIQAVFYKIIRDRQVSDYTFADDVFVMGAGNIAGEDEAHVKEMAAPLRDRFAHLRLERPNAGENGNWTEWAKHNNIDHRVVGFLASAVGQQYLYTFGEQDNKDSMLFATPRSWERLSNTLKAAEENTDGNIPPERITTLAASLVGESAAVPFSTFVQNKQRFNAREYIKEPEKAAELMTDEYEADKVHAAITAIAWEYSREYCDIKSIMQITKHIDAEYGAYLTLLCSNYEPDRFGEEIGSFVEEHPEWPVEEFTKMVLQAQ